MSDGMLLSTQRPIMNISDTSSSITPFARTQSVQASQVTSASTPDGGEGSGHVHKSHGGGHMHHALTQALQSLGLSVPQDVSKATTASQASGSTESGDSTSAAGKVKQDMRQFMHALFQAVKGESTSDTSTAGSTSSDPKTNFAAGLSTLISQVSGGSAPSDLQSAFSKLTSDLQPSSGATTTAAHQVSLQALLTNLQQDLGYGNSSTSAIGNSISTQA